MTEVFCDIVPQSNGWIFRVEGSHSPVFPSYRLAFEAAREYRSISVDDRVRIVLRHQDLRGQMLRVSSPHAYASHAVM